MQQNQHESLFNMNCGEFVCIEQMFQQNSAEKLLVRLGLPKIVPIFQQKYFSSLELLELKLELKA